MSQFFTRRNITIGLAISLAFVSLFVWYSYRNINKASLETQKVNATLQSLRALEDVMDDMQDIETGQRGYIISGNREFLIPYQSALENLPKDTIAVKSLYSVYPKRKGIFEILLRLVRQKTELAEASVKAMGDHGQDSAHQRIQSGKGKVVMDSIRNIISSIETEDRSVLQLSNAQRGIAAKNTAKLFIALAVTFVTGLFIVFWRISVGLKRREKYEQKISYLADLTEKTSDAIFSVDKQGVILSWNKGAEDIYGYSKEEVIGKYAPDISGSRRTREETAIMAERVSQIGSLVLDALNYNKKGEAIHCLGSVTALKNEHGEATGYVAVVRDITERKKAEQLLRDFNEELGRQVEEKTLLIKSILERISDGFYSLNENWCFTYMNTTAAGIMGCNKDKIIGKNLWEEYPEAKDHSVYKTFRNAFEKQVSEQVEFFYSPHDKWFMVQIYPSLSGLSVFFRDITEIKKAESELRHTNERFEMISKTTNDAIWEWNLETGRMWVNETHQQLYGLTMADPVPDEKQWQERIHPDEREYLIKKQEEALASDTNVFITEYRFKTRTGEYKNIYDRCYIVRNTDGKAIRMLGSMMDVTERKKAEMFLKESESKFRAFFENSMDGILLTATDGRILAANSAAALMFGMTEEEICRAGRNGLVDRDDPRVYAALAERKQTGKAKFELTMIRKGGIKFPAEVSSSVFLDINGEERTSMIIRDITERKDAEKRLRRREAQLVASIENTPNVAVQWYNDKGEVLFWNHASELIFGWGASEAVGKTLDQLIYRNTPTGNTGFLNALKQVEQTGRTIGPSEFSFTRRDGSLGYCVSTIFSIPSIGGKPCFVCMDVDITESKKAAAALRESEDKYRSMIEQASDGIFILDEEGHYIEVNSAGCSMIGYTREEIVKMSAMDLLPAGQVPMSKLKGKELKEGQTAMMERKLKKKDGSLIDAEVSYKMLSNGFYLAIARDITEKKKNEEAVRASEETRRLIMNSALDAIICIDRRGIIIVWTPQAEKIFGWKEQEAIGRDLSDTIIPEQFKEMHKNGMRRYLETGEGSVLNRLIEISAVNKEGKDFPIELSVIPVMQGGTEIFCAFIRDISERKEAEEKIIKEKELSETLINSLPGIFYMFDSNRKLLRWNKNFEIVTGYSTYEISQIEPAMFFAEEDRLLARQKVEETFLTGAAELEAHFLTKNGDKISYYCTGLAINYAGVSCMIGTGVDITERKIAEAALKKSEEKLRHILSSTAEDFYVIDRNYIVILINTVAQQNLKKFFGQIVVSGTNMLDILPADKKENIRRNYDLVFAGERIEYEISNSIGNELSWRLVNYVPVSDEKGIITGAYITTKDITERKKAEEEIVKTNARFHIVTKATSDIVWDWNLKDNSLWWNDNYYSALGYRKQKEIVDIEEWYGRIHPEDFKRVKEYIHKTVAGEASFWRDEYRYKKSDGTYLHILDRGYIIRGNEGKAYRMIGSMVDMTPIYNVQRKIVESENRLRTILDTDPECIKLMDAECKLLDINTAGLKMLEADSLEQMYGQSLLPVVADEQKSAVAQLVNNVFAGISGRLEFEMITLKGNHRWCEINAVPFRDAEGKIINALGVTRDITEKKKAEIELKQNEEKYRTLIEQAVDAIALYDVSGKVLDVNTGSVNLLGYTKQELIGMSLKEILTEDEMQNNPVRYDVLEQGKSTVKQRKMRRKDGSIVETEVRSQKLPDGRFLSVIRDLTERITAEKELAESYEAIRKLTSYLQNIREEERTNIAREIHDELGQQLTVLKMDVSWLKKKIAVPDEPVKSKLKDLTTMLDETVKTVRRISSELRPSLLDDLGLVAAMEWQLGEFEKRSGMITNFVYSGDDLQLPDITKTSLFRIFQESLTNIARHSHAKRVTVSIAQKDDNILLSIADNGKGFDKQKVADKRTLGILGMKERIAMIGGKYEIKSHPGKGTEVIVLVPLNNRKV